MSEYPRLHVLTSVFLVSIGSCLCGCTVIQRNMADAVVVTATPSLEEKDVKFALELRNGREEFAMSEADAFLTSKQSARLNWGTESEVRERCQALRRTMAQAKQELSDGIAIVRLDPARPYVDGNFVVYVAGKPDIHILFSCAEFGRLLAVKEVADDLTTIRYTHPAFDSARLGELRDKAAAVGLKADNVALSSGEFEHMKMKAATRIVERYLGESGLAQCGDLPLLTSGMLAPAKSPKLTKALNAPSVLDKVLKSNNPDVLRALIYLVRREVVELEHP